MKHKILLFSLILFSSCQQLNCEKLEKGTARLVAFKMSQSSKLWLENIETGYIQEFGELKGRRIPTIDLGDTISVIYCPETGQMIFDPYEFSRIPENRTSRFFTLQGYQYLRETK